MAGFRIQAYLGLDGTGFQRGLQGAEVSAARFGNAVSKGIASRLAAIFSIGALTYGVKRLAGHAIETADKFSEMAARLQEPVEDLQEMGYALMQNNARAEDLVDVIERLNAARLKALSGDKSALAAFQKLGVGTGDLANLRGSQLLMKVGAAFETQSADRLIGALRTVGGRGATKLVEAFTDGLQSGMDEARRVGAVMSAENIAKIKLMKDQLSMLSQVLAAKTLPAVVAVMRTMIELALGLRTAGAFVRGTVDPKNVIGSSALMMLNPVLGALRMLRSMNLAGGASAARTSAEDSASFLDALDARLKAIADRLQNPPTGAGGFSAKAEPSKGTKLTSDSLVAVGNFLGTGTNTLQALAQRQANDINAIRGLVSEIRSAMNHPADSDGL